MGVALESGTVQGQSQMLHSKCFTVLHFRNEN